MTTDDDEGNIRHAGPAIHGLIATYTLKYALVRPLLSPSAGLLLIEAMHLTTPTVPDVAWGTTEGAGTSGASMPPEWTA